MAREQMGIVVVEMKSAALAIAVDAARLAGILASPRAVAIGLETVLPDLPETVTIDIALMEVGADGGAARYRAIAQNRGDVDTGTAMEERVADLMFVGAEEPFACIIDKDARVGAARRADEIECGAEHLVGELQLRIIGSAAHREDSEDAPALDAKGDEIFLKLRERVIVARVDAGDDIPDDVVSVGKEANSLRGALERVVVLTDPIMFGFETVEANSHRVESGSPQRIKARPVEEIAIGDEAPREATTIEFEAASLKVGAKERLTTGEDDENVVRIDVRCNVVDGVEEIGGRHIGDSGSDLAVATAMAAVHIATEGAFPEEGAERMQPRLRMAVEPKKFKCDGLAERREVLRFGHRCYFFISLTSTFLSTDPRSQPLRSPCISD